MCWIDFPFVQQNIFLIEHWVSTGRWSKKAKRSWAFDSSAVPPMTRGRWPHRLCFSGFLIFRSIPPWFFPTNSMFSFIVLPPLCCPSDTCEERYHLAYNKIKYKPLKWCSTIRVWFKQNNPAPKRNQSPRPAEIFSQFFSFKKSLFHESKNKSLHIKKCWLCI